MELRDIEIFLTLAEELHFGRTAARLCLSPARVTQAIQKQERQIGAPLFERTNRSVRLTPVGQQLRDDLRPLYAGLKDSVQRAQLAGQGITGTLRVGMLPANAYDLRPYWDVFRLRHPQWKLRVQKTQFSDAFATLRRGDIDVLIAWLPIDEPDLAVGPVLFSEPRVLAVATGHELTQRTSISLEIAADFQHPQSDTQPGYWYDAYIPRETRRGRTIERGAVVQNTEEAITLAGMAEIVVLFPAHMTRYWVRPDITYLPVTDMGPLPYAMVWLSETDNEPIRALAEVVRDLGPLTPIADNTVNPATPRQTGRHQVQHPLEEPQPISANRRQGDRRGGVVRANVSTGTHRWRSWLRAARTCHSHRGRTARGGLGPMSGLSALTSLAKTANMYAITDYSRT